MNKTNEFLNKEWDKINLSKNIYTKWKIENQDNLFYLHSFNTNKTAIIERIKKHYQMYYTYEYIRRTDVEEDLKNNTNYDFNMSEEEFLKILNKEYVLLPIKKQCREMKSEVFTHSQLGQMLVISFYTFYSHIPKNNEPVYMNEYWRLYISINNHKICYSEKPNKPIIRFENFDIKRFLRWLCRLYHKDEIVKHFVPLHKNFVNNYSFIDTIPCIKPYNKTQDKINEYKVYINNDDLLKQNNLISLKKNFFTNKNKLYERYVFCQRLKNNLIVFRFFTTNQYTTNCFEYAAIIVDEKRIYPCYVTQNNDYIYNKSMKYWFADTKYLNYDVRGTILEKKLNNIDDFTNPILAILFANKYLYFEQLIKLGYRITAESIYTNNLYEYDKNWWKKQIKPIHKSTYNVNEFLDINNKLLRLFPFDTDLESMINSIVLIKRYKINYNQLSKEDIDVIISNYSHLNYFMEYLSDENLSVEFIAYYLLTIIKKQSRTERDLYYLVDSITMNIKYNRYSKKEISSKDIEDICLSINDMSNKYLKKHHDKLSKKIQSMNTKIYNSKIQFIKNKFKNYHYNNHNYLIRLPNNPKEIVNEGIALNHCVATYVEDMYEEKTTIFFIRNIDTPQIPFYTLELTNNKISQIHGYDNKNIEDDTLTDFVKEWCLLKKIKIPKWL